MGTVRASGRASARMARAASQPSMTGIFMSSSTASTDPGSLAANASTASRPFHAWITSTPADESSSVEISMFISLSSASSTRVPASAATCPSSGMPAATAGVAAHAGSSAGAAGEKGSVTVKVVPSSSVLLTSMLPPICVTRLLVMGMPRPVPTVWAVPKRCSRA